MKKNKSLLICLFILLMTIANSSAQKSGSNPTLKPGAVPTSISVNGATPTLASQAEFNDTLVGTVMKHFSTLTLRSGAKTLINTLHQKFGTNGTPLDRFSITATVFDNLFNPVQERNYRNATTQEITFSGLDNSKSDPFEFKFKVNAEQLEMNNNPSRRIMEKQSDHATIRFFEFNLNGTKAMGVFSTTAVSIIKTSGSDLISVSDFSIEIDNRFITPWDTWFQDILKGKVVLKNGDITVRNFSGVSLFTISFQDMTIISMKPSPSTTIVRDKDGTIITKTRIGLRAKDLRFNMN